MANQTKNANPEIISDKVLADKLVNDLKTKGIDLDKTKEESPNPVPLADKPEAPVSPDAPAANVQATLKPEESKADASKGEPLTDLRKSLTNESDAQGSPEDSKANLNIPLKSSLFTRIFKKKRKAESKSSVLPPSPTALITSTQQMPPLTEVDKDVAELAGVDIELHRDLESNEYWLVKINKVLAFCLLAAALIVLALSGWHIWFK